MGLTARELRLSSSWSQDKTAEFSQLRQWQVKVAILIFPRDRSAYRMVAPSRRKRAAQEMPETFSLGLKTSAWTVARPSQFPQPTLARQAALRSKARPALLSRFSSTARAAEYSPTHPAPAQAEIFS